MSDTYFSDRLSTIPVIGIFRGATPERTLELCESAWAEGVELVEIPVQSVDALPSLDAAVAAAGTRAVGAGTVTTVEQLEDVLRRGAEFIVCPGLHVDVVRECIRRGVPVLPGVATATEIADAVALGASWVKAFPASVLGADWVSAVRAPFPDVSFVATGGIDASNARSFLDAGCRGVAVGSAFGSPDAIAALRSAVAPS
ncbi:bifunctional 4-hydroxy-2-oxoglutarate aldolase/2-dehydro-3-deoxy-phosphogluconate aldolase [Microbacterium sp. NPDC089696]|uniref:bifunctional 4-hydroxy-2-oxoglutarate aldolase/2-dehydro-3-deoxy-phosphogluconate aldolase n=1 Tax=Microbacterium sp. NPDC089696 TaxID=3364199 RepID=UPI003815E769